VTNARKSFAKATICPPEHRHEETSVCYSHHRCRCQWCVSEARARYQERTGQNGKWLVEELIPELEHFLSLNVNGRVAVEQMGLKLDTVKSVLYKNGRGDLVLRLTKEGYH
jgi:hypothetical protein